MEIKVCRLCQEKKTLTEFGKHPKTRDKLRHECRVCVSEEAKLRKRVRYLTDPEYKKRCSERNTKEQQTDNGRKRRAAWSAANRHRGRSWSMARKISVKQATPSWLNELQKTSIDQLHWLARDLEIVSGQTYQVDHIIPLRGRDVCGLHVPWNLQILPSDINLSKGNRISPGCDSTWFGKSPGGLQQFTPQDADRGRSKPSSKRTSRTDQLPNSGNDQDYGSEDK